MNRIIVIGSTNTDMTIQSDVLPSVGDIVTGGRFRVAPGGKGANQAIAAARLGGSVTLITKTGNDLFGRQAKQMFASEGVYTDYIFPDANNPSGVSLIMMNNEGQKYISIAQGSITTLSLQDIDKTRSVIRDSSVMLIELETPIETAVYAARIARECGLDVVINPSPQQWLPDEIFRLATIMIPNKMEAAKLTGILIRDYDSAFEAARIICEKGVGTVIVTMGADGAVVVSKDTSFVAEAKEVKVKDTFGAGDVFCAALCVGLSEEMSLRRAVSMASCAASLMVSREGLIEALPYRYEIEGMF